MDNNLSSLGERVKARRDELKLSQAQLADAIGADQSVIANLERRKGKKSKYVQQLATALGVSISYLLAGKSGDSDSGSTDLTQVGTFEEWDANTPMTGDEVALPFYEEVSASAGGGSAVIKENESRKLRFSKSTLVNAGVNVSDAIVMKVVGDSMERLIMDGATIGVDTSKAKQPIKDNRIYALETNGDLRCKYIQRVAGNKVKLISENSAYADEIYSAEEFAALYRVIGWVFWWSTIARW